MGAIKREMNHTKWIAFAIVYQCLFAYAVSLCIYQIGSSFTGNINILGLIAAIIINSLVLFMLLKPYKENNKLSARIKV